MSAPLWFYALSKQLGLPGMRVGRVSCTKDLRVPMADGVVLLADLWRPAGGEQAPLIVLRSPYGRRGMVPALYGRFFAHQGFQVLIQSCRGTAGSEGAFDRPFSVEAEDGRATVTWLVSQSWYPGSFATFGGSYLGYTQLAMARAARGHHRAAVLQVTPTSVREITWSEGAFAAQAALTWSTMAHHDPAPGLLRNLLTQRRLAKAVPAAARRAPVIDSYRALVGGQRIPFLETWMTADDPAEAYWQQTDQQAALDELDCPVLIQAGWYDVFLECSVEQYQRLRSRGIHAELTVGPWTHLSIGTHGAGRTLGEAADFLREAFEVVPARPSGHGCVRLIELGSDRERTLEDWPRPSHSTTLQLTAGRLVPDSPPGRATTAFSYNPADPTPHVGGATLEFGAGARDNRELEARPDVRTFDSDPLQDDMHLLGNVRVRLTFGSDRPSTSVFIRLCHVDGKQQSINITDRIVTLPELDRRDDGTWLVDVALPPTAAHIPAGDRLRLQISSGAFPRYARHPGTTQSPLGTSDFVAAHQTIHHGQDCPASVELPLATTPPPHHSMGS